MSRRYCFAPGCDSGYNSNKEKVSLFRVPQDKLKEWSELIPREDRKLTIKDALCEKHFFKEDVIREVVTETYSYSLKIPRLREDAKPSIWPNCPAYLTKKPTKKRRSIERHEYVPKRKKNCDSSGTNEIVPVRAPTSQECSESRPLNTKSDEVDDDKTCETWLDKLFTILGKNDVTLPSSSWTIKYYENIIAVFEIVAAEDDIMITKKVVLCKTFLDVYIFQHLHNHILQDSANKIHSLADFESFLEQLDRLPVCFGFSVGHDVNKGDIDFNGTRYRKDEFSRTVRHKDCGYTLSKECLSKNIRYCLLCHNAKKSVRYLKKKVADVLSRRKVCIKSFANCRRRERRLQYRLSQSRKELQEVKEKMKAVDEQEVERKIDEVENIPSAQKMLVMECIKMSRYECKKSRRYSSSWLLMCLLLHIKSPKTYAFLRKNEILPLPVISTVRKYLSRVKLKCGLDEEFFEAFKMKMKEKNEFARQGMLIFDEMSVRVNVHLNVKNLKLVGAEDFGEQSQNTSKTVTGQEADHALVFMWSSLADNFTQPVAVYATKGPTKGTCLAQLILEVIRKLENCGAEVHGTVCDGASTNRKMWMEFGISGKLSRINNKIVHPVDDSRYLYFFSDTPHLIKCLRNRFLNNKALVTPEGGILWEYYKILLELDEKQMNNARVCPKITEMHVNPNGFMKMRVRLATQIFSKSVADGLTHYQMRSSRLKNADCTIAFTRRMNDLFDVLNRRRSYEGIVTDSRDFEVLRENLDFINNWEIMLAEKQISKDQFLTSSTAEGFRVTITSTLELCDYLLRTRKFNYVLTNKMNQDPIERFFGTVRQAGCDNDHPTIGTFLQLYRLLSVYKLLKPPQFGNCKNTNEDTQILSLENFKSIFSSNEFTCKARHIEEIRMKLDSVLENDFWEDSEEPVASFYDADLPETLDCIIYYLTGFICKKLFKESKCAFCRDLLYNAKHSHSLPPEAELVKIKSKGWLNHPNKLLHEFLMKLETVLFKHIASVDVFDDTLEEFFSSQENRTTSFGCREHRQEILSKAVYYYICMRVKQFYRQEQAKLKKKSAIDKKKSKLQRS